MARRILNTLLASLLLFSLVVSVDYFVGRSLGTFIWFEGIGTKVAKYGFELFLPVLALTLIRSGTQRAIFLSLFGALHLLWYGFVTYFHAPLEPHHVLLGLQETTDVWNEVTANLSRFLPVSALITATYFAAGFALRKMQTRIVHVSIAPIVLVALVLAEPTVIYANNVDVRYYPSPVIPPLANVIRTLSIAGITAGERAFGDEPEIDFEETHAEPIELEQGPINVAVVMGESISGFRLHVLGAKRQTTPQIEHWLDPAGSFRLFARGGFSASVATRSTMPLFLNTHWNPRNISLSYERPANLFALAKRNGFQTYVYSVQRQHILMLGGLDLVDSISAVDDRWSEYQARQDDLLIDDLEGMPDGERRFVFLHQHVNHTPYPEHCHHVPEMTVFEPEGPTFEDQKVAEYDNGLRCYDRNLAKIFEYFTRQPGSVYVFVTSDHNDLTGEFGRWGHVNNHLGNTYVPMMLFTNRPDGDIAQAFRGVELMTHFEMSRLVARALGFEVINPNVRPGTFFVSSSGGFGRDGYLEIHRTQDPASFEVIQRSGRDQVLNTSRVELEVAGIRPLRIASH